jgi:S-formylglutathione hydrolase
MPTSWERTSIAGHAADIFTPLRRPRYGVLFLHDTDEQTLTGNPWFTRSLEEHNLACVCPHGCLSWWGARLSTHFDPRVSPEQHLLEDVGAFFQARWQLATNAIGLLGIGMGGQGALRLAFKHPRRYSTVAAIAPALDFHEMYGEGTPLDDLYDSKEACRQDTALLHLPPYNAPPHLYFTIDPDDRWHRGCDRLHEKMTALGIEHTFELSPGNGGHSWDFFQEVAGRAVAFVADSLEQESRRLL